MGDITSTISAILFLASTALNVYITMRLSKFENTMKGYIEDQIKESEKEIAFKIRETKGDSEKHMLREIEIVTDRIDRLDKRIQ